MAFLLWKHFSAFMINNRNRNKSKSFLDFSKFMLFVCSELTPTWTIFRFSLDKISACKSSKPDCFGMQNIISVAHWVKHADKYIKCHMKKQRWRITWIKQTWSTSISLWAVFSAFAAVPITCNTSAFVDAFSRASRWNSIVESTPSMCCSCFSNCFFRFKACSANRLFFVPCFFAEATSWKQK